MESYPIMLNICNKDAVVIGGGKVAYRRIMSLLKAGANVTVISPYLNEPVKKLIDENKVHWFEKRFEADDLAFAMIVVAATNDKKVNEQVALLSSRHQLVNVVDNKEISNFHVPAKLTRGKLTIAVATEGASPTLAKKIRDEIALVYDESYGDYLEFLALAREEILGKKFDDVVKNKLLEELSNINHFKAPQKQNDFFERMNIDDDKT